MDTTTRLAAIEARAKALGWKTEYGEGKGSHILHIWPCGLTTMSIWPTKLGLQAAERLLSCYEPGPPVDVTLNGIKYKLIPVEVDDGP